MRLNIVLTILAVTLAAVFLAGCTDRTGDNPTSMQISDRQSVGGPQLDTSRE